MDNFDNLLNSLMRLLAVQSVQSAPCSLSPFGEGVGKALDIFADTAKKLGFDVHNEGGYYVTADIGEGEPFAVLGHLDTVPFGEGWTHSPLGEIDGGVIYGRGVMDDKGPLLACLFATAQLLDEGYALTRRIRFFAGGNEESGWKCAERYAQLDKWPREGFSPDADFPVIACEKGVAHLKLTFPLPAPLKELSAGTRVNVVPDFCRARLSAPPANARNVSVQERGGEYIVTAHGKPAHGSTPQLGENAAHKVLHALAGVSPRLARLEKALCTLDGSGLSRHLHAGRDSGAHKGRAGLRGAGVRRARAPLRGRKFPAGARTLRGLHAGDRAELRAFDDRRRHLCARDTGRGGIRTLFPRRRSHDTPKRRVRERGKIPSDLSDI